VHNFIFALKTSFNHAAKLCREVSMGPSFFELLPPLAVIKFSLKTMLQLVVLWLILRIVLSVL